MASENLIEFVRRVMLSKNLSSYDVARRSGGSISQSTVNKLLNNDVRSHNLDTLAALAKGIDEPVEKLIHAARGLPATPTRFDMYADAFNGEGISVAEWEFIEKTYFAQAVEMFKIQKRQQEEFGEMIAKKLGPDGELARGKVVAYIEPGKKPEPELTRDDVQRMISGDEIDEIKRRVTPRKKKAG